MHRSTFAVRQRPLEELINTQEPALPLIQDWVAKAVRPVEILPPSPDRDEVLLRTQVTTRSPMGAIVYETGGVLIDRGWLRVLGSGHERLARRLPDWNEGRSSGFYLVADDAVGGFFAIDGGGLGPGTQGMYYFAPDTLNWEPTELRFSAFFQWACVGALDRFYENIRWAGWENDVAQLHGDRCYFSSPPLLTKESQDGSRRHGEVPVDETWGVQMDFRKQLLDSEGTLDSRS
jgi:hypothetical protein